MRRLGRIGIYCGLLLVLWHHRLTTSARADEGQFAVAAAHYAAQRWDLAEAEFRAYAESTPNGSRIIEARYFLAESLVQQSQLQAAQQQLTQFLIDHADHPLADRARFRAGEVAYLQGDHAAARRDLQTFLERQPDDNWSLYALMYLGDLALAGEQFQSAVDHYQRVLARCTDPWQRAECQLGLGQAWEGLGDDVAASVHFRAAANVADAPASRAAQLRLGISLVRQSQFAEALRTLQGLDQALPESAAWVGYWQARALEGAAREGEAADAWQHALDRYTTHELAPRFGYEAGRVRRQLSQTDQARALWERVVTQWPDSEWAEASAVALVELELAERRWEAARDRFMQYSRQFPASGSRDALAARLARELLAHGQSQELSAALAGDHAATPPGDRDFYLALAHLQAGRFDDALAAIEQIPDASAVAPAKRQAARIAALMGLQQYEAATTAASSYLQQYADQPDAAVCRRQLVLALLHLGRLDQAVEQARALNHAAKSADDDALRILVAQKLHQAERYAEALAMFAELRESAGGALRFKAWRGQAWSLYHDGRADEALHVCREYLAETAADERDEMQWLTARVLQHLDRRADALEAYQQLYEGQPPGRFADDALLAAARMYDQADDNATAAALYGRLLSDYPDQPDRDQLLYLQAWALLDAGQTDAAQSAFAELHSEHDNSTYWPDATYRLAEFAWRSGKSEEAQRLLEQLEPRVLATPIAAHAQLLRGRLAAEAKQWQDVLHLMQALERSSPPEAVARAAGFWIAEALFHLGQWREADEQLAQLHSRAQPKPDDATSLLVMLRRSQIAAHEDRWHDALELVDAIAQQYPQSARQHEVDYVAGRALLGLARIDEARGRWQRVLENPAARGSETAAMAQWMIGESYFHQQDLDQAIRAYYRVDLQYAHPQWQSAALLQIGKCRELQGKGNEAAKAFTEANGRDPNSTFAEEARRRLAALRPSGT